MNPTIRNLIILIVLIIVALVLTDGLKLPPEKLNGSDIPAIDSTSGRNLGSIMEIKMLTSKEQTYWNNLEFRLVKEGDPFPGNTPDFLIKLHSSNESFNAMYNKGRSEVFFSFLPRYKYGWLRTPAVGGWTHPLYKITASDSLLLLLGIKTKTSVT